MRKVRNTKIGHKTAEQLLKENPLTGKLAREVAEIEARYEKEHRKEKPEVKSITAKVMVNQLIKKGFTSSFDGNQNVLAYKGKVICWIADRNKWVAVSTWEKGGKNFKTTRVINEMQMKDAIKMIKEQIK